ncbi:MAG: V-type ATP synthase subunit A [Synergistaceae bacterium]|jgi:V/A-type H+-transporting ATPase subunit A|nr:V-type ATP synthase subunit A [Synergistaceae bacterium]
MEDTLLNKQPAATTGAYITMINGPVLKAGGMSHFSMRELVRVGRIGLTGEILSMDGDSAVIQVYEDTTGLRVGEPVVGLQRPLSVCLGPGLIGHIIDGIGRPLDRLMELEGGFISRGTKLDPIDMDRSWEVTPSCRVGDSVTAGMEVASVKETDLIDNKVLVPHGMDGTIEFVVAAGFHKTSDVMARVRCADGVVRPVPMFHYHPVRSPRPYAERLLPQEPLITGQRVIDGLFPMAKGGVGAIPGAFGTGKTVTQHQLAKWSNAKIVVYIGCGERGNEMTQVLEEFPSLEDPYSKKPLMERTVLIANTSNMPVAAREASIYTGVTIAEYYRDMGYDVAMMADSTSRWAEALRELSGRMGEIPAEEGFPAYLATRLAEFYERAGRVKTLGGKTASISVVGAVSPPGGDFTEPVTRHTKRFIRCFWALDASLAHARHFPAISWMDSYSEYPSEVQDWYHENVDKDWASLRERSRTILLEDDTVQQTIRLMGEDVLPDSQRLTAFTASLLKEGYLQQNSFSDDSFCPPEKGVAIMRMILDFHEQAKELVAAGCPLSLIRKMNELVEVVHARELASDDTAAFESLAKRLSDHLAKIGAERLAREKDTEGSAKAEDDLEGAGSAEAEGGPTAQKGEGE